MLRELPGFGKGLIAPGLVAAGWIMRATTTRHWSRAEHGFSYLTPLPGRT